MLSTCAATLRPLSASIATVAVWPTLTLPTSDSLSGTTTCIELRFVRTMNGVAAELEEPVDVLDAPVEAPEEPPAAPVDPVLEDPPAVLEEVPVGLDAF